MNMIIGPAWLQRNIPEQISFGGAARYEPTTPEYVHEFERRVELWERETSHLSSPVEVVNNEHFRAIVAIGRKAVPLIIEELRSDPSLLVAALPMITGEDPVDEDDEGDLEAMAKAWERWAASAP